MIFFDTETCGYHGPIVLLQYAHGDGDIELYSPWKNPVAETISIIEEITYHEEGVCGFNLAFDWFHICQMYNTLQLISDQSAYLEDVMEEYAIKEEQGRFGPCLKPMQSLDLMLHARKTSYQSTMDRDEVRIKRVPTALARELVKELDNRIKFPDIYFARKANKDRWTVHDIFDDMNEVIPDFKDVVLSFAPSSALKALAADALGVDVESIKLFSDVEVDEAFDPLEFGYAPYATAPFYAELASGRKVLRQPSPANWYNKWPAVIKRHITHWSFNSTARQYASDDVKYTRDLYKHFGSPGCSDTDSVLATMVAAVRWRGFSINKEEMTKLRDSAVHHIENLPYNFQSPEVCKKYLRQVMSETELLAMNINGKMTTKGIILEEIAKWKVSNICTQCEGIGCKDCEDGLVATDEPHPAAVRAREILDARHAVKEIELLDKLILAGRFHASFKIIGTLSTRMSGADGLNPQGIKRTKEIRSCFPLADGGLVLCGGDFDGQEVTIADAVYKDPKMHEMLTSGKKIHGIFGTYLFPPLTYEEILETKGLPNEQDKYTRAKNGVFAMLYGGEAYTLQTRVGVSESVAAEAYHNFCKDFKKWGEERRKIFDQFCSMRQPGGLGTRVEWHEPKDYVESLFGFRRYFTLENTICKALFELAEDPPKTWNTLKFKVVRRDREQTACGAVRSALFAAAFAQQAANMRAAANHVIQSSGASLTKTLQHALWNLQPAGINNWRIQPMNVHDEVLAPTISDYVAESKTIVDTFISEHHGVVPLLAMKWKTSLKTWAEK